MQLKKQSHEFLPEGKLKVWVEVVPTTDAEKKDVHKVADFTVTVEATIAKTVLDDTIKKEYENRKQQQEKELEKAKELGIGEDVK